MTKKSNKENTDISLLTLKQACDLLGCHPNTLRQWDRSGLLQAVRFGTRQDRRYRREDILKLVGKSSYAESPEEVAKVSEVRKEYFKDYASLLVKWGNLDEKSVLVDVPCGSGDMIKTIVQNGFGKKFYLIDINPEMIKAAKENISTVSKNGIFKLGDTSDIGKLVPEKVDAIFCLNAFSIYTDNKDKFLNGCYEILKPGGVLIFDVSTRGLRDKLSKEFLELETKELKKLAKENGIKYNFPEWPDEELLASYRGIAISKGFNVDEVVTIDKWMPIDEVVNATLNIPGRLRPWLPNISDKKRIEIYKEASQTSIEKTGIKVIQHNRIFFIAKK